MSLENHDARDISMSQLWDGLPAGAAWSKAMGAVILDTVGRKPIAVNWTQGVKHAVGNANFADGLRLPVFVGEANRPVLVHNYSVRPTAVSRIWLAFDDVYDVVPTQAYKDALAAR